MSGGGAKGFLKGPMTKIFIIFLKALNNTDESISYYREVLKSDSTSVEAIASIATHHFYSDQPEIALSYYRYTLLLLTALCIYYYSHDM